MVHPFLSILGLDDHSKFINFCFSINSLTTLKKNKTSVVAQWYRGWIYGPREEVVGSNPVKINFRTFPFTFVTVWTVNFTIPFKMQLSSLLWCVCSHQLCGWNQITSHSADNSSSFDNWSSTCPLLELSWLKVGSLRPFNGAEDGKGSSI